MASAKPAKEKRTIPYSQVYTGKHGPYAEQVCKDCGALGCLIPIPHGPAKDQRLKL